MMPRFRMLKYPSAVFVCQNAARTYSSALWLTVPWPPKPAAIDG
jgi:hypothetical protein